MESIIFERTVSLDGAGKPELLQGTLYAAENQAHTFRITAVKEGAKVELAGTVSASFIRPNQETVAITGSIDDGCAVVTLPQSCYVKSGRFTLTIFVTSDGVKVAVFCLMGNVKQTTTDTIVDPGEVMPAYEDLIEEMEEVRDSIPEDYSELSESVADLKSAISEFKCVDSTAENIDLDVADGDGKVLVRFADGHIRTKNFDSSDLKIGLISTNANAVAI